MNKEREMNKFIVCCLILTFPFISSYARFEAFDYCGLDNYPSGGNPFFDRVVEHVPGTNDWGRFEGDRLLGVSTSNVLAQVASAGDTFYYVAVEAEFAWVRGNANRMRRCFLVLGHLLKLEDGYSDVLGTLNSRLYHNRVCYMLARMVNYRDDGRPQILPEDIDSVFPRMEPLPHSNRICFRQETFRRMLKIGVAIEKFLKDEGRLPARLDEVGELPSECLKDAYGDDIEYAQQGMSWKLYAPCKSGQDDFRSVRAIVPCVEIAGGATRGLYFSSSYSADRCSLYENKVLKIDGEHLEVKWPGRGDRVWVE